MSYPKHETSPFATSPIETWQIKTKARWVQVSFVGETAVIDFLDGTHAVMGRQYFTAFYEKSGAQKLPPERDIKRVTYE